MTKKKTKDGNQIAVEFRSIATDAVKMLKGVPFVDVRQQFAVSDLFARLADNDIALQDLIRKQQVQSIVDATPVDIVPPAAE